MRFGGLKIRNGTANGGPGRVDEECRKKRDQPRRDAKGREWTRIGIPIRRLLGNSHEGTQGTQRMGWKQKCASGAGYGGGSPKGLMRKAGKQEKTGCAPCGEKRFNRESRMHANVRECAGSDLFPATEAEGSEGLMWKAGTQEKKRMRAVRRKTIQPRMDRASRERCWWRSWKGARKNGRESGNSDPARSQKLAFIGVHSRFSFREIG